MTPDQEEQVRRALASVPPAQPVPPEVAARLDARLADLVAERESASADRGTVEGGDTSRRRRWPAVLVAAALVGVVGVGVGTVLDNVTPGSLDAATEAGGDAGSAPEERAEGGAPLAEAPTPQQDGSRQPSALMDKHHRYLLLAERIRLGSETLRRDVSEIVDLHIPRTTAREDAADDEGDSATAERKVDRLFGRCDLPATAPGDRLIAVRLDGDPATLALRRPEDGTRVAQVYSCADGGALLAHTRVSAR